jgi:hypothetical protein
VNIFFVCGAPKSGTTWLQRILDAHPEVVCSGEGHFIDRFSLPAAEVINAYNRDLGLEADQVYEGEPPYQPLDQDEFDELVRGFILRRLRTRAGSETRWMGDKTPAYARQLTYLHRLFPAAKIIHIVRDPREVAVSRMAFFHRAGAVEAATPGTKLHRENLEAAIHTWTAAVTCVDRFGREHPDLLHEVQYRDLHANPIGETERLFAFLGAPTPRVLIERIVAATSFEAMTGRRPGEEDPTSFLRKGVPGDWQAQLDRESAQAIAESCGALMRRKRFAA